MGISKFTHTFDDVDRSISLLVGNDDDDDDATKANTHLRANRESKLLYFKKEEWKKRK